MGRRSMTWEEIYAKHARGASAGCIEWGGTISPYGYGVIAKRIGGAKKSMLAHRYSWIRANGPIPGNMKVCHRCDNPRCVNINHLFLGTQMDNMRDMQNKGRQNYGHGGRPCSRPIEEIKDAVARGLTPKEIMSRFGVGKDSAYRWIKKFQHQLTH